MRNLMEYHFLTHQKEQIKSLKELNVGVKLDKKTIYVDPSVLFSRFLLIIERDQRMIEYFHYELTPVPMFLFEDGMMRKSTKSVLVKAVTKNVPRDASYVFPVYILDGGALLRKIKWISSSTVHNVIFQYCQYIKFNYGLGCVIFDGYDEKPCIKDHEHQRRSRNGSSYRKVDLRNKIQCSQKAFLKTKQNVLNYFENTLQMMDMISETMKTMLTLLLYQQQLSTQRNNIMKW